MISTPIKEIILLIITINYFDDFNFILIIKFKYFNTIQLKQ